MAVSILVIVQRALELCPVPDLLVKTLVQRFLEPAAKTLDTVLYIGDMLLYIKFGRFIYIMGHI